MGHTTSISTMKWWDPHTNKLKYCSSTKFDEHKNKFVKGLSPVSELMTGTIFTTTLTTYKPGINMRYRIPEDIFTYIINIM